MYILGGEGGNGTVRRGVVRNCVAAPSSPEKTVA